MRSTVFFAVMVGLLAFAAWAQHGPDDPIDWNYARGLIEKSRRGGTLTPEEQAYLDRARKERAARNRPDQNRPANAPAARDTTGLVPLEEMTAEQEYKGQSGGLYGGGKNTPPESQEKAAADALARIAPLDADGKPSPDGKIVLVSMG
ncbi:MAG TPA: hypothetical protein VMX57_04360, partial [Planctomycetota bacterium]|nr:hypothetical protein [Planctomycetota bacterium]